MTRLVDLILGQDSRDLRTSETLLGAGIPDFVRIKLTGIKSQKDGKEGLRRCSSGQRCDIPRAVGMHIIDYGVGNAIRSREIAAA
jgi:hypothetical protein